jgi:membrane dipeptidase
MKIKFADLHNDAITEISAKKFTRYVKTAEKLGVTTILVSVWTTNMKQPMQEIQKYRQQLSNINTKINLLLHIEDAWFINEQNIHQLISFKPFSVGLTWNSNNDLAGGANEDGNLTPLGKSIIETLSANNILIDLAHLNKQSFYQTTEILNGSKLLCTHTCFHAVHPHPRNLDHAQIQTIVDSGGLVGLTLVTNFLGGDDVYTHIKYFLDNFGENNLSIGTDFFGTTNLPKNFRSYKHLRRFKKFLLKKGLPETTIDKIFHINYHDFQKTTTHN